MKVILNLSNRTPIVRLHHEGHDCFWGHPLRRLVGETESLVYAAVAPTTGEWRRDPPPNRNNITEWTASAAVHGCCIVDGDMASRSGCHLVKAERIRPGYLYTIAWEADCFKDEAIMRWILGGWADTHAWIAWYVSAGPTRLVGLKQEDEAAGEIVIMDEPEQPPHRQGNLSIYQVDALEVIDNAALPQLWDRRIYNHTIETFSYGCGYYLRWFVRGASENMAEALVRCFSQVIIKATDHPPVTLEKGIWLLRHPRPSGDVD